VNRIRAAAQPLCATIGSRTGDQAIFNSMSGGWRKMEEQGSLVLLPKKLQSGQVSRIGFLAPQTLNGEFRQFLRERMERMAKTIQHAG
jgi:hypothetical protein